MKAKYGEFRILISILFHSEMVQGKNENLKA